MPVNKAPLRANPVAHWIDYRQSSDATVMPAAWRVSWLASTVPGNGMSDVARLFFAAVESQ